MDIDDVSDTLDIKPSAKITVVYNCDREVIFGGELTPTDVVQEPEVTWDADPNKYYTLSMVDPDAPSRDNPIHREVLHWLVVNVKGNDITTGVIIASYVGSLPPQDSGFHRYIFLVFEQESTITVTEKNLEIERKHFSIKKFAKKYNFGKAYAGNFYKAQWDSSVAKSEAQN